MFLTIIERISSTSNMSKRKHIFLCGLLVTVCFALTLTAAAVRVGAVVNYALATDIRAFLDGYEIPVYNIDGYVSVVAEDLRGYGFSVLWDGTARTLSVTKSDTGVTDPVQIKQTKKVTNGKRIKSVLHTDIVTYVNGTAVPGYNIDGKTVIKFESLKVYGNFVYDDGPRLAMLSTTGQTFQAKTLSTLPKEVIHAGGVIGGFSGSNSLEALNASYEKGHRFFELDFLLSSDGIPICLHTWSEEYGAGLGGASITAEAFSQVKIFGRYTSVTLDRLSSWMGEHPDAYIVTDVKDDNITVLRTIAQKHPEIMPRLIPQIHQYDEYVPVRAMGYSNIILTLYSLPRYEDKVNRTSYNLSYAKKNSLLGITANVELVDEHKNFVQKYTKAGVPLFVHTVNDAAKKEKLFSKGVTCIYTDYAE